MESVVMRDPTSKRLEDLVLLTLLTMAEVDVVKASRNIKAKTYHI